MIKEDGSPYVIEYNVRFGDPECQVLMMLMKSNLYPYLEAVANETLGELPAPEFYEGSALTVVMCSGGYPEKYQTNYMIDGLDAELSDPDVTVFHAGTQGVGNHRGVRWFTDGGRVLNVTAKGISLKYAREKAYNVVEKISWEDSFYRSDIGAE
jgi:phosphoribosylamine--glycine ligase